ncbi:MAG: serine/threonine-protein kinase [Planctomycetota bacterium]
MSDPIAGYQIEKDLGPNAWGRAYRARQVSLDRPVYLTLLHPDFESIALARACAALTHPHLVSGIDLGECDRGRYLVQEWAEGPTIGDVVHRGGPVAEERGTAIALATAHALDAAARKGIVHGRIDPEAILITSGGSPKIRGFGPNRNYAGTPEDYRAPEQKAGEATDVRADIYSLGATLYFALSGRYPFTDAPPAEVVDGVVIESPHPLGRANRRLHAELVSLVERMMAWRPDDRFSGAGALAEEVEKTMDRIEAQARTEVSRQARPARRARPARPAGPPRRPRRRRRR